MNKNYYTHELTCCLYDKLTHERFKARSAWRVGVCEYAEMLLLNIDDSIESHYSTFAELSKFSGFRRALLIGAENWHEFSWGGSALVYDWDIARTLCAPWELRKTDNGRKPPNSREDWLDVQERALIQAAALLWTLYMSMTEDAGLAAFLNC